jgi:hypothetical protein
MLHMHVHTGHFYRPSKSERNQERRALLYPGAWLVPTRRCHRRRLRSCRIRVGLLVWTRPAFLLGGSARQEKAASLFEKLMNTGTRCAARPGLALPGRFMR